MESKSIEFQTVKKKKKKTAKKSECDKGNIYKFPCCGDNCGSYPGMMGKYGYKKYQYYKDACKFNYRNRQGNLITADVGDPDHTRFLRRNGCRSIPGSNLTNSQQIKLAEVLGRCAGERENFTRDCVHDSCHYEEKNPGGHLFRIQDLRNVQKICENNRRTQKRGSISRRGWGYRRKSRRRKSRRRKSRRRKSRRR
jgi:hypothetical protein